MQGEAERPYGGPLPWFEPKQCQACRKGSDRKSGSIELMPRAANRPRQKIPPCSPPVATARQDEDTRSAEINGKIHGTPGHKKLMEW
jgi:hypothetical protein